MGDEFTRETIERAVKVLEANRIRPDAWCPTCKATTFAMFSIAAPYAACVDCGGRLMSLPKGFEIMDSFVVRLPIRTRERPPMLAIFGERIVDAWFVSPDGDTIRECKLAKGNEFGDREMWEAELDAIGLGEMLIHGSQSEKRGDTILSFLLEKGIAPGQPFRVRDQMRIEQISGSNFYTGEPAEYGVEHKVTIVERRPWTHTQVVEAWMRFMKRCPGLEWSKVTETLREGVEGLSYAETCTVVDRLQKHPR